MLTQARPARAAGTRPIVIAPNLSKALEALEAHGIDPDDARARTAILTPLHCPLAHVQGLSPDTPVIDVFPWGELDPGRHLPATLEHLRRVLGRDDVGRAAA